jgi:hypothetical protein
MLWIAMSLSHVLLTSLLEKPSTGFELARRFDRSMGFSGMRVINKFIVNSIICWKRLDFDH